MSRSFRTHTPLEALLVEQALLLARQLQTTADTAPDGQVLAAVEGAAVPAGRGWTRRAVEATLQAQADGAEKKGRRAAPAPGVRSSPGPNATPPGTS